MVGAFAANKLNQNKNRNESVNKPGSKFVHSIPPLNAMPHCLVMLTQAVMLVTTASAVEKL